jgi:hypothetical protein
MRPVRRGFCASITDVSEYWIARWSLSSGGALRRPGGGRRRLGAWHASYDEAPSIQFSNDSAFPRRDAPGPCMNCSPLEIRGRGATLKRGRGESRVPAAPAASRAKVKVAHELVTTGSPEQSGLPCAMVLTAYFVLSPATNSCCHRHRRIRAGQTRSGRLSLRKLDTSNGCQDHTTSPYASAPFVRAPAERSRARWTRPALCRLRARRCRVHRIPCPTSVTIAIRPSVGRNGGAYAFDLGQAGTEKFFDTGLDRWDQIDPVQQITASAQRGLRACPEPDLAHGHWRPRHR